MRNLTEWEQRVRDAADRGEPAPALVITQRDPDETVVAELVVLRGTRVVMEPLFDHGPLRTTVERIEL